MAYTISNTTMSQLELRKHYNNSKKDYSFDWDGLDLIFEIALNCTDRFPGINISHNANEKTYLEKWVKGYYDAQNNLPSQRIAKPKTACTDPAIRLIVQSCLGQDDVEAIQGEKIHNLFMSAENIQGNLLEEYIAENVKPYGFLWCNGNVLRAIDFCNTDGSLLLQIKNKSNTENSSSSTVREGTSIEKWYRLGTRTISGKKIPNYKWPLLNKIINDNKTSGFDLNPCDMSEEGYLKFISRIAQYNTALINGE